MESLISWSLVESFVLSSSVRSDCLGGGEQQQLVHWGSGFTTTGITCGAHGYSPVTYGTINGGTPRTTPASG